MAKDRVPVVLAVVAAALYIVAFALLSVGGEHRTVPVVLLGVLLLFAAAILLQVALAHARRVNWGRPWRLWIPVAIMVAGLGLAVFAAVGRPSGGWGLCGACAAYLGAGEALAELRSRSGWAPWRGLVVGGACAVLFAVGLALCLALDASWLALALAALLIGPVGLSLLTADVLRSRRLPRALIPVGLLAVIAGGALLWSWTGLSGPFLWAAMGLLCLLILAIGSSTQADVLLVVTAIALIWAATPRASAPDDTGGPTHGLATLAALGDSYMSGEGAHKFYAGTNEAGGNQCRRAPTAYARRVVSPRGALRHLAFFACSGAETRDLGDQLKQLDSLMRSSDDDVKLVIVSIGGNDAGFETIGEACVAPGSCVERGQAWLDKLSGVKVQVDDAYQKIRAVVDDRVPVLAVPYPDPIRPETCDSSLLDADEHRFVHGFVGQLDAVIRQSAKDAGFHYLGAMEGALRGIRICDHSADIGVNFIALSSVDGFVDQVENPVNWIHDSFHPNELGHAAMARVLERWLRAHPHPAAGPAPAGTHTPFTAAPLEDLLGRPVSHCGGPAPPVYCDRDDTPWALTQVGIAAGKATLPVLLVAGGWWLLWLPVLAFTGPFWSRKGVVGSKEA